MSLPSERLLDSQIANLESAGIQFTEAQHRLVRDALVLMWTRACNSHDALLAEGDEA